MFTFLIVAIFFLIIYAVLEKKFKNRPKSRLIAASYCFSTGFSLFIEYISVKYSYMPLLPQFFVSCLVIIAGIGIIKGKNWGRILFVVICPFVLFPYTSNLNHIFRGPDIPLVNIPLGISYLLVVLLLSRQNALLSLGVHWTEPLTLHRSGQYN